MLDVFWVLFYLTVGIYTLFLLWLFRKSKPQANQTISKLSVVIPFKNEAGNLKTLLSSFGDHSLLSEIILVDDHSSDNWEDVFTDFSNGGLNLRIVTLNKEQKGKKAAIHAGIESAMEDWVLTLDADTQFQSGIWKDIDTGISQGVKYDLIPLHPIKASGCVRAFFDLEFLALHMVGLRAASQGRPLLSNGAASLVEKKAYLETVSKRTDWDIPSGDDLFTMFAISKEFGNNAVGVLNTKDSFVQVSFPTRFKELYAQRMRWMGKTPQVQNPWFSAVSMLTLFFNLLFGWAILETAYFHNSTRLIAVIIPFVIQGILLSLAAVKFHRTDLLKWIFPSIIIYPFYLLSLVLIQYIWKPKWK